MASTPRPTLRLPHRHRFPRRQRALQAARKAIHLVRHCQCQCELHRVHRTQRSTHSCSTAATAPGQRTPNGHTHTALRFLPQLIDVQHVHSNGGVLCSVCRGLIHTPNRTSLISSRCSACCANSRLLNLTSLISNYPYTRTPSLIA